MESVYGILDGLYFSKKPSVQEGVDGISKNAVREFVKMHNLPESLENGIRAILNNLYFACNQLYKCDWTGGKIVKDRLRIKATFAILNHEDYDERWDYRDRISKYMNKKGFQTHVNGPFVYIMNLKKNGLMVNIFINEEEASIEVYPFGKIHEGFPGTEIGLPIDRPNCEDKKSGSSDSKNKKPKSGKSSKRKEIEVDDSTSVSGISTPSGHLHPEELYMYESEDGDIEDRDISNLASVRVDKFGNKHLQCPKCKSEAINIHNNGTIFHCVDCGFEWPVVDADNDSIDDEDEPEDMIFMKPKAKPEKKDDNEIAKDKPKKDTSGKQSKERKSGKDTKDNKTEKEDSKNNPTKDSSVEDVKVNMKNKTNEGAYRIVIEAFESIDESFDNNILKLLDTFCEEHAIKDNEKKKVESLLKEIYTACNKFSACDFKESRIKAKELKDYRRENQGAIGRYELLFNAEFADRDEDTEKNPTKTIDILDYLDYQCKTRHRRPKNPKNNEPGSRLIFDVEADLTVIVQQARDKTMYIGVEIMSDIKDEDLPPKKQPKRKSK